MSRSQTRRGVSLNRAVYDAVMARATQDGVSASEVVTRALRLAGVEVPETVHVPEVVAVRARIAKIKARTRVLNGWVDRRSA